MSIQSRGKRVVVVAVLALVFGVQSVVSAGPGVSWWRFEGQVGNTIGIERNALSPGFLDGTGENQASYIGLVPGSYILDRKTGKTVANDTAFHMYGLSGGGRVRVLDHLALDQSSFTIEAFIYLGGGLSDTESYVSHRDKMTPRGWRLDIDSDEDGRARFDAPGHTNQVVGGDSEHNLGTLEWHHTALTYDAVAKEIRYYVDYGQMATLSFTADATTVNADFLMGDWADAPQYTVLDEVYYSNAVLSPTRFLRAVSGRDGSDGGPVINSVDTYAELTQVGHQLFAKAYAEVEFAAEGSEPELLVEDADVQWWLDEILDGGGTVRLDEGTTGLGGPDFSELVRSFALGTTATLRLTADFLGEQAFAEGTFTFIPEPGSLVLFGLGALGVAVCAWRKRRRKATPAPD